MPFFSVIIPTQNRAALLQEAVTSVLGQSFGDYELIIVDDASTDSTPDVLRALDDSRLITMTMPKQSGPSAARNAGVRRASGDWLAFLDSDDLWLPRKLVIQSLWIRNNPKYEICQTEESWLRDGKPLSPKKHHRKEGGLIFRRALELCLVSPSAVAIERQLFLKSGGFDESLPACEDYDLWLRLLHDRPIGLIEEPLVIKRAGAWPQLSRDVPSLDRYRILSIAKLLDSGRLSGENFDLALEELKKKCAIYIKGCVKHGRGDEATEFQRILSRFTGAC